MDPQIKPMLDQAAVKVDPRQAARALGALLRQTPEYEAFMKAHNSVNNDLTFQRLEALIRAHERALRWSRGRDDDGRHAEELTRLELEIEALPLVREFRLAEEAVRQLFRAVDEVITQEAGVAFALNAKRSGCCG